MEMKQMKTIASWFVVHAVVARACLQSLQAAEVTIVSPDTEQTFAFGSIIDHQLKWDGAHTLNALITFSTLPYVGKEQPRVDETFAFRLPGVTFDPATRTFYARAARGERVPVAAFRRELIVDSILPLDGTKICVFKKSGHVRVVLTATSWPRVSRGGLHWIERDENFSLQNLVGRSVKRHAPARG
jgi:hypothetical protein